MFKQFSFVFATLALSTVAFAQSPITQDWLFQIGYAANLNIGDSAINISNNGVNGGFYPNTNGVGNICVNIFTFDPSEEEVSCCSCLVTPNALVSLSAKNDLISNVLTPAIPTSIVVKLVSSTPYVPTGKTSPQTCNPSTAGVPVPGFTGGNGTPGMLAWGVTLEPSAPAGTYNAVNVPFLNSTLTFGAPGTELVALDSVCQFIQANGTGFGICKSCALGALNGSKQ